MGATWSCSLDPCPCKTTGDVGRCHCVLAFGHEGVCVRCKATMAKQSPGVAVKSGLREGDRVDDKWAMTDDGDL